MLPDASRLHTPREFAAVVRGGRRGGAGSLVVHVRLEGDAPPRAGFVVSGKIGNSVVRHRITRRLRPLVRARLTELPLGCQLVVRALAPAVAAGSAELDRDLRTGLATALRRTRSADRR